MAVHKREWMQLNRLLLIVVIILYKSNTSLAEIVSYTQILEARQLFVFTFYKDVQIFHYRIPSEVVRAKWIFAANESRGCIARNVSLYLQYGSYPVLNPDNSTFPPNFHIKRSALHSLTMLSDSQKHNFTLLSPTPGDWFLVAFLMEKNDKIQQKGLFIKCSTWLTSKLKFQMDTNVTELLSGVAVSQQINQVQYYKFYVPSNTWTVTVTLKQCSEVPTSTNIECPLVIAVNPLSMPSATSSLHSLNCSSAYQQGQCILQFVPYEEMWHYIRIDVIRSRMEFQITVETEICENGATPTQYLILSELKFPNTSTVGHSALKVPNAAKRILVPLPFTGRMKASPAIPICWPQVPLARRTFPGNFLFEYTQEAKENSTTSVKLELNNSLPTILAFPIQSIVDIGGTLTFELGIDISVNSSSHNISVTACLEKGMRAVMLGPGNCSSGVGLEVNTSSEAGRGNLVMIPYPEPGNWYITLTSTCYHLDSSSNELVSVNCESNTTAVIFNIMSGSCVYGGCGPYGRCYQYISGGFIFSTCVCSAGWRGWGCTDGTNALSDQELLIATLLLTLSNLLFLPAIILAVFRKYYTEALVYFFTMFFSTFYHACDEEAYTFCLMRLSVMQFCDFYSAILSFWVTLIAMADLPSSLTSLAHMAGALGVAVGVEYDRTGLWVFVIPSTTGIFLMIISWIFHCYKQKSCFPKKKIWLLCLLPGILLTATGLVCFAFLETRDNYKYVHSGWHAAMALAILFLLPPQRKQKGRQPSRPSISYIRNDDDLHDFVVPLLENQPGTSR